MCINVFKGLTKVSNSHLSLFIRAETHSRYRKVSLNGRLLELISCLFIVSFVSDTSIPCIRKGRLLKGAEKYKRRSHPSIPRMPMNDDFKTETDFVWSLLIWHNIASFIAITVRRQKLLLLLVRLLLGTDTSTVMTRSLKEILVVVFRHKPYLFRHWDTDIVLPEHKFFWSNRRACYKETRYRERQFS